ncbi:hypothetical protein TherJR_0745 [Thermincola potens JR]|uniref:Uncharacterized protein n=1 Tax=Thermincola potens (strain JR) TaxID=635013 RepID=D5XCI6_THEPJ|nr:hypothetical protein TherJR_0745 [Thermincola potens JR]
MFSGAELWFNPPVFYGGGWGDWATPELCAAKPGRSCGCRYGGKTISCDLVKGGKPVLTTVKA